LGGRGGMTCMKGRIELTAQRVSRATCPPEKAIADLSDAGQPGLMLRVYRTGHKVFMVAYRVGAGRTGKQRWLKIGDAAAISIKAAREAARAVLDEVAKGGDPAGERKEAARRERARLGQALDRYEASLEDRHVVKRADLLSLLRRELLVPLGNIDLAQIDRPMVIDRLDAIARSGRPGAARELRVRAGVFLGWAADQGLIKASPLAGWRQPRRTRAQRLERSGRALSDAELPILWSIAGAAGWPFGAYLQVLLLLGQRRTETAMMRWSDIEGDVWTIPATVTKSGRAHRVPLPRQVVEILNGLPRLKSSGLVFPGRHGRAMTGWNARLRPVYDQTAARGMAPWMPHDLRRTVRTGLGRLGVEPVVAELLLNHAVSDELIAIYDRGEYWQQRAEAAAHWADYVTGTVEGGDTVVPLRRAQ
jgi:integrase